MEPCRIIWLASYPKSGNTWFRAFLTALLNPDKAEVDINNLYATPIASSRQLFDEIAGVASADLSADEIDELRPAVYRQNALEADENLYHKVHDAYTLLPSGEPLFPTDVSRAVLYFIRNPLDVAVSFANHLHTDIDKAIDIMNKTDYAFCDRNNRLASQLRQRLLTWSSHVRSWTEQSALPIHVVRYEDMLTDPQETFTRAAEFIGLLRSQEEITRALGLVTFERLKKQEEEKGFSEKNAKSESFFRKGVSGDWKHSLTDNQVQNIIRAHGEVMEQFGYLPGYTGCISDK